MTRIAIASDHAGFHLEALLISHLMREGFAVNDFATESDVSAFRQEAKRMPIIL